LSEELRRVLACPVRMLTTGKNGGRKSDGNRLTKIFPENGHLNDVSSKFREDQFKIEVAKFSTDERTSDGHTDTE